MSSPSAIIIITGEGEVTMSEKLWLLWNDFQENVSTTFGSLRNDNDFTDVTLACEDGYQMEAHKVILASSSPFFQVLFEKIKHPHPMIYLKGFQPHDLVAVVDFLYCGKANIFQENLDSFLTIAEDLKLKGLAGQKSDDLINIQDNPADTLPPNKEKLNCPPRVPMKAYEQPSGKDLLSNGKVGDNGSRALIISGQFPTNMLALDEKVKSMMTKSPNMIPGSNQADGSLKREKEWNCKVCQKEGTASTIKNHIEANHLEGIVIPCNSCDKVLSSRNSFSAHKSRDHKNID